MVAGKQVTGRHGESGLYVTFPNVIEDGAGNEFVGFPDVDGAILGRLCDSSCETRLIFPGGFGFMSVALEQQFFRTLADGNVRVAHQRPVATLGNDRREGGVVFDIKEIIRTSVLLVSE